MPYDVPAGIAAFGGGLASGPGANNPFNNVFGSVAGGYTPDRSFEKVVRVMELERALSADRRKREKEQKALEDAAELRQLIKDPRRRELFDVDQKTAIAQEFPEPLKPSDRYRTAGSDIFDITGEKPRLAARGRRTPEPLERVIGPDGQPRLVKRSEAIGETPYISGGIQFNPDGTIKSIGGPPSSSLTKKTMGALEEGIVNAQEGMSRLQLVEEAFNSDFLTYQGAAKAEAFRQYEKVGGALSEEKRQYLSDFTTLRQSTGENLARYIKEISGAAASDSERKDLAKNLPAPSDSATQFITKTQNKIKQLKAVNARLNYFRTQGITPDANFNGIRLSQMPQIIQQRGEEMEKELLAAGVPPDQVELAVRESLKVEFGL